MIAPAAPVAPAAPDDRRGFPLLVDELLNLALEGTAAGIPDDDDEDNTDAIGEAVTPDPVSRDRLLLFSSWWDRFLYPLTLDPRTRDAPFVLSLNPEESL